jgi:hypothetical protein
MKLIVKSPEDNVGATLKYDAATSHRVLHYSTRTQNFISTHGMASRQRLDIHECKYSCTLVELEGGDLA